MSSTGKKIKVAVGVFIAILAILIVLERQSLLVLLPSGDQTQTTEPMPKKKVRFAVVGSAAKQHAAVEAAINRKMEREGVPLQLEVVFIAKETWRHQVDLMLAAKEEFELLQVDEETLGSNVLAGRGAILPLNDLVERYGADLTRNIPASVMEAAKVNGRLYAVPVPWAATPVERISSGYLTMRADLIKQYELTVPETRQDFIDVIVALKNKWVWPSQYYFWVDLTKNQEWLYRTMEAYPFRVDANELVYVDSYGTVKPWIETEQFKEEAEFFKELYGLGILHPNVLSVSDTEISKVCRQGQFLFSDCSLSIFPELNVNLTGAELKEIVLSPEKPRVQHIAYSSGNAVPATAKQPEAGIQFLNWLYSSKDNYELLRYGIKDKHWLPIGDRQYEPVLDDYGIPLYSSGQKMFGNFVYERFLADELEDRIKQITVPDERPAASVASGFSFDSSAVSEEYAKCLEEMKAIVLPIKAGLLDYDAHFPAALQKMRSAGLDNVVKEYENQFKRWLQERKKQL
ncbi:ABC transporter substrate-binding protein [Paenibacillus sp. 481]|uniref:ABC transporter substrate-binding protein n=1 Tax=Paenibacillus sp. 481 TaxID=2835869 RepID=UPI001E5BD5F7|nr:extracellular solute-binding protein [Paenibacillus sp. 481]UHA73517.1 extracellular solute-binding protein [Paenibacillus sp. 481]